MSTKFEKELSKFIAWVENTEYKISDVVDNTPLKWNEVSLSNFEEPGRNKLETYIKELMKCYFISKDDEELNDIKLMTKEFREYKPKRKMTDTKSDDDLNTEKTKSVKKMRKTEKSKTIEKQNDNNEKYFDVVVSDEFDTSNTWYLRTLSQSTDDLLKIFGKPIEAIEKSEYQYEWKIMVGDKLFSIYNWLNDDNEFYDYLENEWYLAGTEENTKEEKYLVKYLKQSKETKKFEEAILEQEVKEKEIVKELKGKAKETVKELKGKKIEEEEELNELEETEDYNNIEEKEFDLDIELDLIDDDNLEINIDDIDFDF